MTSPLLRLFAVFWWLLVVGSTGLLGLIVLLVALYPPSERPETNLLVLYGLSC